MKVRSAWQVRTGLPGTRPVKSSSLMCLKEGAQGYETPGEQRHLDAVGLVCLCKAEQELPGIGTLVFSMLVFFFFCHRHIAVTLLIMRIITVTYV